MTCFMWSLSCHGHRWEHGMMCHDHGMSMYDMSCLNTGCLAMTVASCPCMTCHGICMKDVPCLCHHTCPRGHGGLLGGQVWGGGVQHQKSCGINFNKFLHEDNFRHNLPTQKKWSCSRNPSVVFLLNIQ